MHDKITSPMAKEESSIDDNYDRSIHLHHYFDL